MSEQTTAQEIERKVPVRFVLGGERTNAQRAWLDGYDTGHASALHAADERIKTLEAETAKYDAMREGYMAAANARVEASEAVLRQVREALGAAESFCDDLATLSDEDITDGDVIASYRNGAAHIRDRMSKALACQPTGETKGSGE